MANKKSRVYKLDGDAVKVMFRYDKEAGGYFGEYPDFTETPRITPHGRRWVNAIREGCQYADEEYGDCGSCHHFRAEQPGDLIGVCDNEKTRVTSDEIVGHRSAHVRSIPKKQR